jgi:hypothetical protein
MFIRTATGRRLDPRRLKPEDIDLRDVAHGLANITPWPQAKEFYSLAQRAAHVFEIASAPEVHFPGLTAADAAALRSSAPWALFLEAPAAYSIDTSDDAWGAALWALARTVSLDPPAPILTNVAVCSVIAAEIEYFFGRDCIDAGALDPPMTLTIVPAGPQEAEPVPHPA